MADLLKAAKDPKFREDVIRGLGETFSRGVAGVLGAPVDLTTMAMRPFGYNVPAEQVVGGSEYIGRKMEEAGLISSARNPVAEFLANVVTPDPMDVARLGAMAVPVVGRAGKYITQNTDLGKQYLGEHGSITVMENSKYSPRPNSITEFVVNEGERGKGYGSKILDDVLQQYKPESISAAVSSPSSLHLMYKKGFRPISNPNASKEDAMKMLKDDSSVTMVMPERKAAPRDEAMRIAQANAAKPVSEGGLGLPPDNTAMDRAKAMGFDTEAFHATGANFEAFNPSAYRKASFFAGTPEGAMKGRAAGQGDLTASGKNENIMPVMLRSESVEGLSFTPKEKEILSDYKGTLSENKVNEAMEKIGKGAWYNYFDEIELPSGEFVYQAKSGSKPYQEVKRTGRDVYGSSLSDYDTASAERFAADYAKNRGMKGFMQRDEGGLSIAVTEPSEIRSRFAAFDPAKRYESDLLGAADPRLLAGVAGATGAGLYGASRMQEGEERPQPRFGFRPDGTPKGEGWLGVLPLSDGNVATEYSMQSQAVKVGDQMVDFPTLVPTLNQEEVNLMLSDIIPNRKPIPEPIVQKAIKHAKDRLDKGLSPFKELGE